MIFKYLTTAGVVVLVSEVAKRSDKLGALIAALPLVTILALIWLHIETGSPEKVSNHAWYTFWYVVPTLPMFLTFPFLLGRIGFWPTMLASAAITVMSFWLFTFVARYVGVDLMP
nr:DUF3147 family protein [Guyparkeria hydrothermalis]